MTCLPENFRAGATCRHRNWLLSCILAWPSAVLAQPATLPDTALEEVVVVANRVPLPLRRIAGSVSIVDAARLEAHGSTALAEVLQQQSGIGVSRNGGAGQPLGLRIRGEEGFRTLTLLDGIRLADPAAPQIGPLLEHVLSSGIDRVELLRGPQGLGYGADAGGVVAISTRRGEPGLHAGLDLQSGSFGTRQLSGNVSGGNERADFFVALTRFDTEGFNSLVADARSADRDGYRNDTLHLRGSLDLGEHWRLDAVRRDVDGAAQYDNCFSATNEGHDCLARVEQQATRLALSHTGSATSHSLSWQRAATDRDSYASGTFAFGSAGVLERGEYVGSASGLPGFALVWGADHETARNNGVDRDNTGVYLEYLSDFSDTLYFTAGLRHDDNDDFGSNTSHRLSAAYLIDLDADSTLKFKASHGSGFRAPSPYEVQYNSGSWAYPPASLVSLKQERSEGWEAGIEYVHGYVVKLEAVWFDQQVEDAIFFDQVMWSGYLQDIGTSSSQGVELSGELGVGEHWRLTGNYTWNDTERPNGLQRLRRPQHLFNAGLSWYGLSDQRLNLNAFLRASRGSIDEVGGLSVPLPDFEVLDLTANLRLNEALQLYGRIENALDEDYQEVFGYHTPGRAAYVGFRLNYAGL